MNDPMMAMADQFADLDRRLRTIEGGQRVGLSSIKADSETTGGRITSYGSNNWQDLGGITPSVTLSTGTRAIIIASARLSYISTPVTGENYRSNQGSMGIQVDGTEPHLFFDPTMTTEIAEGYKTASEAVVNLGVVVLTSVHARQDLVAGEHTFTMKFFALQTNLSGTVDPLVANMSLVVIPLGFG